ncbi:flagellar hook protein FlgE [Quadrisphaera sp. DSM 44207]|uniref:flagellar hook protein FlgE n=1 Tax=Quadrisphaera sp. DSM 44207 TaxID=1881057 RepID=UPI00087E3514|nr:flagellar hook protein FlgE [Quadrisphaera sp. DSM 44207]SDQ19964.1 flagellar hook protein FlgE [Quadrisphaera sp. DSM 44207]
MLRSLYSGISGLRSHQTMMDVTGNNIANVNTTGFKSSSTQFQDTLSQLVQAASAPQGDQGGTNPAQVGLGVRVAGITTSFTQGAAQVTGRSTDLMISGDGFFVVQDGGEQLYTRAGAFNFDATGKLVTTDGAVLQGWMGTNGVVDANGPIGDIQLPVGTLMQPRATQDVGTAPNVERGITFAGNLASDAPAGPLAPLKITVFDDLGTEVAVQVVLTKQADGSWQAAEPATTPPAPAYPDVNGTVRFTATGQLDPTSAISVVVGTRTVTVDLDGVTGYAGDGTSTVKATEQNGYASGTLTSFTLNPDGTLNGTFSNGLKQDIGRVAMSVFANPTGLEKAGGSTYRTTANSGNPEVGTAGTGGRGTLSGGALEMSNVDLSAEFTNLIVAQRGFQSSSRVITTSDELLQELVNLKR